MKFSLQILLGSLLILATLASCRKEENADEFSIASQDMAISADLMQDIEDQSNNQLSEIGVRGCAVLTTSQPKGIFPNTITIDFGNGCTGPDGRSRIGKMIINVTDSLKLVGSIRIITLENYSVNGIKIEGTVTVTNQGKNSDGEVNFTRIVNGAKLTFEDGTSRTWSANQTITYKAGFDTKELIDDVFSITGNAIGIARDGSDIAYEIIQPLIKSSDCKWIESGTAKLTRKLINATIDFGGGTCDRNATITGPNGKVSSILLRP